MWLRNARRFQTGTTTGMADASSGGGQPQDTRKRSLSYLSSIFRRTVSIADAPAGIDEAFPQRRRRFSESSVSEFDGSQHGHEVADALHQNIIRSSLTADPDTLSEISYERRRSLPGSSMEVGYQVSSDSSLQARSAERNPAAEMNDEKDGDLRSSNVSGLPVRETSQTDYLNKRLLESFLARINSVASTFIDTSGTGPPRSDDVLMDKILRRTENAPTKKD